jgi:hypothetical protein
MLQTKQDELRERQALVDCVNRWMMGHDGRLRWTVDKSQIDLGP